MFILNAVLGHQSTNNKLIQLFSNYKYIYTISYGVDMLLLDVGNVCFRYSMSILTAVLGHQSTNNKLIKLVSNYKYIYTISYGVDMLLLDVRKCFFDILCSS
jgi:hypothetical protein